MFYGKALVVEDHPQVIYTIRPLLQACKLHVDAARTIGIAESRLNASQYDLVVLDRNLPDGDGIQILEYLSDMNITARCLVLSERGSVSERTVGLETGADDYLAKPFSSDEFLARVKALLRRSRTLLHRELQFGGCTLRLDDQKLIRGQIEISLTPKEFELLRLFFTHPGRTLSRESISTRVWPVDRHPSAASIDTCIKRLRLKLRGATLCIVTRYNLGYELITQA